MARKDLAQAKDAKKDEFYTQLSDIEKELVHYREYFRDKVVFCNCDDPYESNFFKYFALNFNALGLKKLIATCYDGSPIAQQELPLFADEENKPKKKAYKVEISEVPDLDGNGTADLTDVQLLLKSSDNNVKAELKGNGDFRSPECVALLDECDIVVTNPPFSLLREFIETIISRGKDMVIIANEVQCTSKNIFPLFQTGKLNFGYNHVKEFRTPDGTMKKFGNIAWFTTLKLDKYNDELPLTAQYEGHEDEYPKYDNYDAIEVNQIRRIPRDYFGIMGVYGPSFFAQYNKEQFEVIGVDRYTVPKEKLVGGRLTLEGKIKSARLLIRRKK